MKITKCKNNEIKKLINEENWLVKSIYSYMKKHPINKKLTTKKIDLMIKLVDNEISQVDSILKKATNKLDEHRSSYIKLRSDVETELLNLKYELNN